MPNLQMTEFCQKRQSVQNIIGTVSNREEKAIDGGIKKIVTANYHSETWNSFVRSKELEQEEQESQ